MKAPFLEQNPEFQKNWWLEMSTTRLVIMPLVLGMIFFFGFVGSFMPFLNEANIPGYTALTMFVIITILWGSKSASETMSEEVRENTWDWQRMSVITPWKMVVGKLLGATVYQWYGGIICIVVYLISIAGRNTIITDLKVLAFFVLFALFAQALSMLLSLITMYRSGIMRSKAMRGIFVVTAFFYLIPLIAGAFFLPSIKSDFHWFFIPFSTFDFILFSISCFTAWVLVGLNRLMRAEFQYANGPATWMGFIGFLMLYQLGMQVNIPFEYSGISMHFGLLMLGTAGVNYVLCFFLIYTSTKDISTLRRLVNNLIKKDYRSAGRDTEPWMMSLVVAVTCSIILMVHISVTDWSSLGTSLGNDLSELSKGGVSMAGLIMAIVFFVLRDVSIILYASLVLPAKRADATSLTLLAISYYLLPQFLNLIELDGLAFLFYPLPQTAVGAMHFAAPMLEFALIAWLYARKWKELNEKINREALT